jgi:ribosomal protein S20
MPIIKSAKKSMRKSLKSKLFNNEVKKKIKLLSKTFLKKLDEVSFKELVSQIDKAGKKKIFHKNKIARLKAKFSKKLKMAVKETKTVEVKKKTASKKKSK